MGLVRIATKWVVLSIVHVEVWVVMLWSRHGRRNLELNDKSLVKVLVPWHDDLRALSERRERCVTNNKEIGQIDASL